MLSKCPICGDPLEEIIHDPDEDPATVYQYFCTRCDKEYGVEDITGSGEGGTK